MAWEERTVEQVREEFVRRALARERTKAALCREYGISRPTGDKWIERFQEGESMADRSRQCGEHTFRSCDCAHNGNLRIFFDPDHLLSCVRPDPSRNACSDVWNGR